MFGAIYKVTNRVNGKVYIGQTTMDVAARWRHHVKTARRGSGPYFHSAIVKYGASAFEIEVVDTASDQFELDLKERHWIAILGTLDRRVGYNTALGGNQSPATLPEVRAKISATLTGRKQTVEQRVKAAKSRTGLRRSEETKAKMSAAQKGRQFTEEQKEAMRKGIAEKRNPDAYRWTPARRFAMMDILIGHEYTKGKGTRS